jgi:hypothetical protein
VLAPHERAVGNKEQNRGQGIPLSAVVADGVQRWFQETYREAQRGDIKMQALLGEMLQEGYGCDPDPEVRALRRLMLQNILSCMLDFEVKVYFCACLTRVWVCVLCNACAPQTCVD